MKLLKKGDLSIRYVVLIALGIIVLIIVTLIFHYSSSDFAERIRSILGEIWAIKPKME